MPSYAPNIEWDVLITNKAFVVYLKFNFGHPVFLFAKPGKVLEVQTPGRCVETFNQQ